MPFGAGLMREGDHALNMSDPEIDTPVRDVMTTPVQTVEPETTVAEAARTLSAAGIGSLVVGTERIDGIITEMDVVASVADERDPTETTVADLMTDPVVTIAPDETLRVAGERMGQETPSRRGREGNRHHHHHGPRALPAALPSRDDGTAGTRHEQG